MGFVRVRLSLIALVLVLVAGLAVPLMASAGVIHDTPETGEVISLPFSGGGLLTPVTVTGITDYEYWYRIPLNAGDTIEVTSSAKPETYPWSFIYSLDFDDPYFVGSDTATPGVETMTYMAPHTGTYAFAVVGSESDNFTAVAATRTAVPFSLKAMSTPKTAKAKKNFSVSAKLAPAYNSSLSPIKFYCQKKNSKGVYKPYSSKTARMTWLSLSSSKASATFKLGKGKYRFRARFTDIVHPVKYNSYHTVTVK
jgi:hypothetical protein